MWFDTENKLLYLATPITASRATERALLHAFPGSKQFSSLKVYHRGLSTFMDQVPRFGNFGLIRDWTIFTTVRDPRDWLVSYFLQVAEVKTVQSFQASWEYVFWHWVEKLKRKYDHVRDRIFYHNDGPLTHWAYYETLKADLEDIVGRELDLNHDPNDRTTAKADLPPWQMWWTKEMDAEARRVIMDFKNLDY